jgi:hypothetical protein
MFSFWPIIVQIHNIMSKVCLDINAPSWSILLNFLEASFVCLDKNSSCKNASTVGSGTVDTAANSLVIIRLAQICSEAVFLFIFRILWFCWKIWLNTGFL